MTISVLRVRGAWAHFGLSDAGMSLVIVGLVFGAAQMIRDPEEFKYVEWIGEGGIAAIGGFGIVTFVGALLALVWGTLRDAGVVPILYAWRSKERVLVGSIMRVLGVRMIPVNDGERVEVREGTVQDAIPATHGAPRGNPWRLSAPAGRIRLTTTYKPGPDHFRQVVDWLVELGIDARVSDVESR